MKNEHGLTLVEMMVVVSIVAVLSAVAVPVFTGDESESGLRSYVRKLSSDLRRARYEALSSREDRVLMVRDGATFGLEAVIPGTNTFASVRNDEEAPAQVEIAGVLLTAAEPGTVYTPPGNLPAQLRFTALNEVLVKAGGGSLTAIPSQSDQKSATIFLQTKDAKYRARVVVYSTTASIRVYDSW